MLMITISVMAQKTISGKITDSDGQGIPSASVTVEEPGSDAILAYGISNSKGEYKVTFTSSNATVDLKVKAFNQKSITKNVSNESQTLDHKLVSEATEIKEVKIKTKLITKKGDTISYDLKAFESKADRSLADVLKKMPGIEVQTNGTILYQGEPLNKFYVNGKDLMEGGYGTITNALPKDAVSKVEVLENHQPVKILQDKVSSENAAINIKLKSKVTMTGRGEVGVGMDPFLWNVKLTPMFFGQKNQWVVNYKTNNNGESVENDGNILGGFSRFEGRRGSSSARRWTNVDMASTPSLPEKRYLMNNVHFFSANLLTNPFKSKDWELKLNANYSNNAVERESYRETVYEPSVIFPNGLVNSTNVNNNLYSNSAKGEVIFQKNAKKGFFKNTTTWNGIWNDNRSNSKILNSRAANPESFIGGISDAPTGIISNSLSTIIPWKEKMVNFMSFISYQKDRQNMNGSYTNFGDFNNSLGVSDLKNLNQSIELKTLSVSHSASVGFTYKKWTITPEAGLNLNFNDMESQLGMSALMSDGSSVSDQLLGAAYQNRMRWNEVNPYTQVGLNYKGASTSLNVTLPVNFYGIAFKDDLGGKNRDINKTVFTPNIWFNYDFASFFKFSTFGNINYNYGNFGDLYMGNILSSPRFMGNNDSKLPENRSMTGSTRLEYRNPLNNLFFNVRYSISENKRNLITRTQQFESGAAITDLFDYDNKSISQSEGVEIGKYFPKFKANASLSFSNRDSNNYSLLLVEAANGTTTDYLTETKTNGQTAAFKFNNTYFSWLSVDYNISFNWNNNKNLYFNTKNKTSGWNHNLATYIYPLKNHTFGFFWDDITTQLGAEKYRNSFYDISYQYTWEKKKIDFELKWLNIANTKTYEVISYNATYASTSRSVMAIRPSQVMFTVKFNFK